VALRRKALPRDQMFALIWEAVRRVPRGSVATYGQIASMVGYPRHSRLVGRALGALPEHSDVPWQRIVNASGDVSTRTAGDSHELQRLLLEAEGIAFTANGRIDLERYRWDDDRGPGGRVGNVEC
jgi:methylated-DNA-protein-cysteine methyltransferase-like protein